MQDDGPGSPLTGGGCRFCGAPLQRLFVDLGVAPLANSYLTADRLGEMEPFYPQRVYVCDGCFLVQLGEFASPEQIFGDYAYFASYSDSWLAHARDYVAAIVPRLQLNGSSQVVEIASNDGYLLQYFVERGIRSLGIEPAANVAAAATARGVPTHVEFFGESLARNLVRQGLAADLVVGNNVLAHVPAINDFVSGLAILVKPEGVITLEFPHLLQLVEQNQFDTIYHEHFSYFSLSTVVRIFERHGLEVFDVEELATHGGSLRVYARRTPAAGPDRHARVAALIARERQAGLMSPERYRRFGEEVMGIKRRLLEFLIRAKNEGRSVAAYGAPAKGNTLLNYCGVRSDMVEYTVDRSPHKQGRFLPGTRIPIFAPDRVAETRPAYLLILPWNLKDEVIQQMDYIRSWGGQFVVAIPDVAVYP